MYRVDRTVISYPSGISFSIYGNLEHAFLMGREACTPPPLPPTKYPSTAYGLVRLGAVWSAGNAGILLSTECVTPGLASPKEGGDNDKVRGGDGGEVPPVMYS